MLEDVEKKKKLRFGSIAWFKFAWGCIRYKDYTARDVAVDGVSSARSYGSAAILATVNAKLPWIWPALKAAGTKIAAFFAAVFAVGKDLLMHS